MDTILGIVFLALALAVLVDWVRGDVFTSHEGPGPHGPGPSSGVRERSVSYRRR